MGAWRGFCPDDAQVLVDMPDRGYAQYVHIMAHARTVQYCTVGVWVCVGNHGLRGSISFCEDVVEYSGK
jgi:hypothetical protein